MKQGFTLNRSRRSRVLGRRTFSRYPVLALLKLPVATYRDTESRETQRAGRIVSGTQRIPRRSRCYRPGKRKSGARSLRQACRRFAFREGSEWWHFGTMTSAQNVTNQEIATRIPVRVFPQKRQLDVINSHPIRLCGGKRRMFFASFGISRFVK